MKKLLIILTVVCLIFPSCKKTPVITLSVDKSEISANGIDVAKFKVICNDENPSGARKLTKIPKAFHSTQTKTIYNRKISLQRKNLPFIFPDIRKLIG